MEGRAEGTPSEAAPGRRFLTVLFADLSGSTELAEVMEAEHYAAVLSALRKVYQDTIPRHGGQVVRVQGDGLLAIFGHPVTREDDGRMAVAAALEIHQRVSELQPNLPGGRVLCLHSGIHAGLVLLREGDVELGRFELLGPVPNIAARLSDAAGAHEVWVSEETLGPASRFFVTGPPRLLPVKGRAAPVLVYRVDARAGAADPQAPHARLGASAFVGREQELARLAQAMDRALAGQPRAVAVLGPPGMGKTRLIEQFLARQVQRGCAVLRGYCDSDLGAEPLQPFRHMLQSLTDPAAAVQPAACSAALLQRAQAQPLLLFIDDWQWADDASHQVLALLRQQAGSRLLIVLSVRQGEAPSALAMTDDVIPLPPLSDAQAIEAIRLRLPGADPFVAQAICAQATGNPLFLEELCHAVDRGGADLGGGRTVGGSGWLNRLVESRVQRLSPPQVALVRVAAVIGNVVPAWLLERMTGQPADGPAQRGLALQDFIFPGERAGTLRFKHGLTRDIIYESVGLHVRQELHLRIAQALGQHHTGEAQDEVLEALALHFDAGGDAARAAHHAELAGDKALAASALDRARKLYRLALAALDRLPPCTDVARRWVDIALRLGRVCVFDPERAELPLYVRAVQQAEALGDAGLTARARHWLGYISYGLGDARAAIVHGEQALALAQQAGDDKLAMQVVAALGEAHCATAQYGRGLALLDQAIAVKRLHRSPHHINVGLAFSLVCRAYLLGDRGEFALAHEAFDEAADCIAGALHEIGATLHGWRGAVLLWQGRWDEAQAAAEQSARICEATRCLTQLSIARAMSARAQWMLSRQPACLQTIDEVTAWLAPRQSSLFRSLNHGWLAAGLMHLGRRDEARRHAARALQRGRQGDLLGAAMSYRALAGDAAVQRPAHAAHYLALALRAAQRRCSAHEVAVTHWRAAEIAWGQQQMAAAQRALDEASQAFERLAMPWHLAQAHALRQRMAAGDAPPPLTAG